MDGIDQDMEALARLALPTAERLDAMERDVFARVRHDTQARSAGRTGVLAAAALALAGGVMAGALSPAPAEASVGDAVALAPSTLLVGG